MSCQSVITRVIRFTFICLLFGTASSPSFALVIENAQFHLLSKNVTPLDRSDPETEIIPSVTESLDWDNRSLPDYWDVSGPENGGHAWYRLSFQLTNDQLSEINDWAIYIPRHSRELDIYLNGQRLGTSSTHSKYLTNNWLYPFLFPVYKSLLNEGDNQIDILLSGSQYNAELSRVYIGNQHELLTSYRWRYGFHITVAQVTVGWMAVLCLSMFLFWSSRPKEIQYLWFSLSCICGALYSADRFVRDLPDFWSIAQWSIFFNGVVGWHLFFITLFLHQFLRLKRVVLERVYLTALVTFFVVVPFLSEQMVLTANSILHVISGFFGIYMVYISYAYHNRNAPTESNVIFAIFSIVFLLNINDFMLMILDPPHMEINLLQWSPIMLSMAMFWLVLSRLFHTLVSFENLNSELQTRVDDKTKQLVVLERQKILHSERQRMMADFHDGIGGYLVNAINLLRSGKRDSRSDSRDDEVLISTLNNALNDLRFIISNITHENVDVGVMLGTFRDRIEPFLKEQEIELIWDVGVIPSEVELDSSGRLNILRILQEASTNVIKHANASQVTIRTTVNSIEIEDNGQGSTDSTFSTPSTAPAKSGTGVGINSMTKRAKAIGASLSIFHTGQGTCVTLRWPSNAA